MRGFSGAAAGTHLNWTPNERVRCDRSALELTEVRRQRHAWDREALQALRDGEIERWANAYREHERIVARPTAHSVRSLARAAGQLGTDEVIAGDRAFSVGDRIVCERNDRRTDLVNGARGLVTRVDPERSTLTWRERAV